MKAHNLSCSEVAKNFSTSLLGGLTKDDVIKNRTKYGVNEITPQKRKSFIKRLIEALSEPTLIILEFAWVITLGVNVGKLIKNGSGDFLECLGIMIAILLSASLTLIMEGKSEKCGEYRVQSLTNYFEYLEETKREK